MSDHLPEISDEKTPMRPEDFDAQGFLKQVTTQAGVYQMYGGEGQILYVGKAKNLKNRLSSYFRNTGLGAKTRALVSKICQIEVTVTSTEMEALLLEQNLIKQQHPPYNILLRDDKSYPYVRLTSKDDFPRLAMHRGVKRKGDRYFGPYPNVGAVKSSLAFLQKTFRTRQCEDSVFRNRSRPCLQYQINRCTAPCVDLISKEDYAQDIRHVEMFLSGRSQELISELVSDMEQASASLEFEKAALYRDQIAAMQKVQAQQVIEGGVGNLDVVAYQQKNNLVCVQILFVREGRILGSKSHFPKVQFLESDEEVFLGFLEQYYLQGGERDWPREVLLSHELSGLEILSEAFRQQLGRGLSFQSRPRGQRSKWLQLCIKTAEENLQARIASKQNVAQRFDALQQALGLAEQPERLECFDISHSHGELTTASCVVFDGNGPLKSDYRRFNIDGITPGDDYAAMAQALERRYTRIQKGEGVLPDILLVDGGKGQLTQAREVFDELGVTGVMLLGVAKGSTRKAGFETLILGDSGEELSLDSDNPGLHLIQHIRDEAHRFAITGHKNRRDKKRRTSRLEDIPGIGAKRRKALLHHFGGIQGVQKASIEDLARVPLISKKIAEEIYGALHSH